MHLRSKIVIIFSFLFISTYTYGTQKIGSYWEKIPEDQLPTLVPDGQLSDLRLALERQRENCHEYASGKYTHCKGESTQVTLQCDEPAIEKMIELLDKSKGWADFYGKVKANFDWLQYRSDKPNVLFTGYNAPTFEAALKPDSKYRFPVYTRPSDLVDIKLPNGTIQWKKRKADGSLTQYDDRKVIDIDKSLSGKKLEVAYIEDPLDIMRLQIEGSGILKIRNTDGSWSESGANFAGKNGYPIVSLNGYLKSKGVDSKYYSFSGYKKYFRENPDELWPAMITNPSYTFFNISDEPPCGTVRTYLTPGHTLAVDPTQVPLGSLLFIEAERPMEGTDPDARDVPMKPFSRFALAQDTGGPIQGAHVDVYFGSSEYAQLASNSMATNGNMFTMKLKKSAAK